MRNLFADLKTANTEEEVKNLFARFFKLKLDTKNFIDLYTPQILFEFKFDADLNNLQNRAKFFAQALYYIRRLKYENDPRTPSRFICVVTKFAAAILNTANFKNYYSASWKTYDWDRAASSPDKNLISNLAEDKNLRDCHVYNFKIREDELNFIARLKENLQVQLSLFDDKKIIDEFNFESVFELWRQKFQKYVQGERKPSEYFITDIEGGKSSVTDEHHVLFRMNDGSAVEKFFPMAEYKFFWRTYAKIDNPAEIIPIRQRMDVLTEINRRRFTGEFFTPNNFARKAAEYLARTLGDKWWKSGNFRLWDMAAGTGNLEFALPADALPFCYISTLLDDDAAYCKKIFPAATVFQYDYLNDDVEFLANPQLFNLGAKLKMPKNLREDLDNPKIKWIIFINPPYATASTFERKNRVDKVDVSMTKIRKLMTAEDMGAASRELYVQFLYRISREFKERKVWLGMFSTLKYINSNNDQKIRDKFFKYQYERGFVFSSQNFDGCKGKFPVGFLIWNLAENISLETQKISMDVFNSEVEKFAVKNLFPMNKKFFLNKWVKRPPNVKKFPPMSSALNVALNKKIPCDKIPENFLASLMCWNDFLHQNYTALLSGPYGTAGGMSITPENFAQYMIIHAVHLIPKSDWLNNRDQFMQPLQKLSAEFICDAAIWSLFAASNQTVSLRNVEYEGKTYRMQNNLYPFLLAEIKSWKLPPEFALQTVSAQDRFAALWLAEHAGELSVEARAVLAAAQKVYRLFYEKFSALDVADLKVEDWDAGWYQVRMAVKDFEELAALKLAHKILGEKLLPQIYELGFLRDEVIYL